MTIPHPDNPEHVDNLKTIALLEAQGFVGTDADLYISLAEYDLAWRQLDSGEYLFVYRNEHYTFDRTTYQPDLDVEREWDWALSGDNGDRFFSCIDRKKEDWMTDYLPTKIFDLLNHYGPEEIFGTTYWEGFKITDDEGENV